MQFLVLGTGAQCEELMHNITGITWEVTENPAEFIPREGIDAYFNLGPDAHRFDYSIFDKPVFINSVAVTTSNIKTNGQVIRVNGWYGFLLRSSWEICGEITGPIKKILQANNKDYVVLPDEPGFVSPRIISMIINEAYFAKAEDVSTENEIDIAMKLGTNYPFGPFEWAHKIGLKNIYSLLSALGEKDNRYLPNKQLAAEATS